MPVLDANALLIGKQGCSGCHPIWQPLLPDGWVAEATMKQADIDRPGCSYGYQWWTRDDGTYMAQGIFGRASSSIPSGNWS